MLTVEAMSKPHKKKEKRKQKKCVVCSSKLIKSDGASKLIKSDGDNHPIADNALSCYYNHQICTVCVRDLLHPVRKESSIEVGLAYICPVCNCHASIAILHNLVLVTSSWEKAYGMFEDKDHLMCYLNHIASFRDDEDNETDIKANSDETPADTANSDETSTDTKDLQISLSNLHLTANSSVNDDSLSIATASQCVVCMSAERSHAMIPCGHKCLCINCATNIVFNECPLCRTDVQFICEIYE